MLVKLMENVLLLLYLQGQLQASSPTLNEQLSKLFEISAHIEKYKLFYDN
jgi:hypothetical protein